MVSIEKQLEYIYYLDYININSKEEYYKLNKNIKSLYLNTRIININKLPNTLIKFSYLNSNYLNNLPLNLKYLYCKKVNCNLPPNIIYLGCEYCDVYNLPRFIQFIYINYYCNQNIKLPIELIDYNYNKNNITFLSLYNEYIIKLKSIY